MRLTLAIIGLCASCAAGPAEPSTPEIRARVSSDLGNVLTASRAASAATTANLPGAMSASVAGQLLGSATAAITRLTAPFAPHVADALALLDDQVLTVANDLGDGIYQAAPGVRLRVALDGDDGVDIWVQIADAEPIELVLHHDELRAAVDLGDAGAATFDLRVVGPAHVTASLEIVRAIAVDLGDASLTSAAGDVLELDLDGSRPQLGATLALGATTLRVGDDELDLPGASFDVGFDGHALTLDDVSFGLATTTFSTSGRPAIAIDVNPSDGRTFGAVLATDADGLETLAVAPALDVIQQIDHAALGDVPPVYDVTHVGLDAALRGVPGDDQLEVVHGTFAIETSPASYGVVATDARCVTSSPASAAVGRAYTQLAVATCD
jgi:hypothetical protein